MIRIALPNKGRLADSTRELLSRAGLDIELRDRALQASLGGEFLALFVNARDIPEFVADGAADLGITGGDLVEESRRPVRTVLELGYGRCRLAVAARDDSGIATLDDVPAGARVATVFPNLTRAFFEGIGRAITLVPISGAAEVAPHLGVADIIVDLVSTGSTLKVNGLVEVATVLESSAVLIARDARPDDSRPDDSRPDDSRPDDSRPDDPRPHDPLERATAELVAALESVLRAQDRRYLMANVPRGVLPELRRILPGINGPTIVDVMDGGDFVAAHAVVAQSEIYRTIAELKRVGAEGILVTRIERLMP